MALLPNKAVRWRTPTCSTSAHLSYLIYLYMDEYMAISKIDLSLLRMTTKDRATSPYWQNERITRVKGRFLKGPVLMQWLELAEACPGKGIQIAIAIWHMVGMTGSRTIKIPKAVLQQLGISRYALYRALPGMEDVGLISVLRMPGASPAITVLDVGAKQGN